MANCKDCPSNGECSKDKNECMIENNPNNNVKHIIGVMSGKGGVGKSTVAALIACELKRKGFKVGILDADITGPSMPRLFGIENEKACMSETGIFPVETKDGILVMSMNLITEFEEQAVIWRGPMIAGAVKQFWTDVIWGELDYLLVDMPPGTGDVPLTVMQSMPLTAVIMVSTPQKMVSMIVAKAINMTQKMDVEILGVIENMTYLKCAKCGEKNYIFGERSSKEAADLVGTKLLGELPLDSEMVTLAENGEIYKYIDDSKVIENIADLLK